MFRGVRLGVPICEDIWRAENVVECLAETGGEILLVPNGSPYWRDKDEVRLNIAVARVVESGLPLVYLNMVGGQDELVFDGASFGLNADRSIAFQLPAFRENGRHHADGCATTARWRCPAGQNAPVEEDDEADYAACVLGLRDYVDKNGFKGVVLGPLRRHRFARCAPRWRSMRWARARALRDAAVSLHLAGFARGCRRGRQGARRPIRRGADRRAGRGLRGGAEALFAGTAATSPKRTCSRARAAPS